MAYRDCDTQCSPDSCPEFPCEELTECEAPFWVYVSGPLSGEPGEYLANVAAMSRASRRVLEAGMCPLNPAGDMLDGLASEEPLSVEAYQRRSLALLELLTPFTGRCAMLVLSRVHRDGRPSFGVQREIAYCESHGISIADSLDELRALRWRAG